MAANGIGIMRPSGKSPPFLAIGLVVTIIILGFNYWSLRARNGEQANEISLMESELRLVNAKKVSAEKRSDAISDKVKELEEEIRRQKEALGSGKSERSNLEYEKNKLEQEIKDMKSQLATANSQKETCEKTLQTKQNELQNEQKKNKTCSESDCKQFVTAARDKVLKEVYQAAGGQPLVSMLDKNMDLGEMRESVVSMKAVMEQHGNVVLPNDKPNLLNVGNQPAGNQQQPAVLEPVGADRKNKDIQKDDDAVDDMAQGN